jgi:hypothetical protein
MLGWQEQRHSVLGNLYQYLRIRMHNIKFILSGRVFPLCVMLFATIRTHLDTPCDNGGCQKDVGPNPIYATLLNGIVLCLG